MLSAYAAGFITGAIIGVAAVIIAFALEGFPRGPKP